MCNVVAKHIVEKYPLRRHQLRSFRLRGILPSLFLVSKPVLYATSMSSRSVGFSWLVRLFPGPTTNAVCCVCAIFACIPAVGYIYALGFFPSFPMFVLVVAAVAAVFALQFTSVVFIHRSLIVCVLIFVLFCLSKSVFDGSVSSGCRKFVPLVLPSLSAASCNETMDSLQSCYGSLVSR